MSKTDILQAALSRYGGTMQMVVAMEEMAELTKEISKHIRGADNDDHLAEEIADVRIMLDQMMILFDCTASVKIYEAAKMERLRDRLEVSG